MIPDQAAPTIRTYGCPAGHRFFHAHTSCTICGAPLTASQSPALGRLVCQTTVYISADRVPYRLGLAEIDGGLRTLCVIDDGVRTDSGARVILSRAGEGGLVRAARAHEVS